MPLISSFAISCNTSILVSHIRESPDIAEADSESEGREEELAVVPPRLPLLAPHPDHRDGHLGS